MLQLRTSINMRLLILILTVCAGITAAAEACLSKGAIGCRCETFENCDAGIKDIGCYNNICQPRPGTDGSLCNSDSDCRTGLYCDSTLDRCEYKQDSTRATGGSCNSPGVTGCRCNGPSGCISPDYSCIRGVCGKSEGWESEPCDKDIDCDEQKCLKSDLNRCEKNPIKLFSEATGCYGEYCSWLVPCCKGYHCVETAVDTLVWRTSCERNPKWEELREGRYNIWLVLWAWVASTLVGEAWVLKKQGHISYAHFE